MSSREYHWRYRQCSQIKLHCMWGQVTDKGVHQPRGSDIVVLCHSKWGSGHTVANRPYLGQDTPAGQERSASMPVLPSACFRLCPSGLCTARVMCRISNCWTAHCTPSPKTPRKSCALSPFMFVCCLLDRKWLRMAPMWETHMSLDIVYPENKDKGLSRSGADGCDDVIWLPTSGSTPTLASLAASAYHVKYTVRLRVIPHADMGMWVTTALCGVLASAYTFCVQEGCILGRGGCRAAATLCVLWCVWLWCRGCTVVWGGKVACW